MHYEMGTTWTRAEPSTKSSTAASCIKLKKKKKRKQILTVLFDELFAFLRKKNQHTPTMTCRVCPRPNTGNAVFPMWSLCVECAAMHLHSNWGNLRWENLRHVQPWLCILSSHTCICYTEPPRVHGKAIKEKGDCLSYSDSCRHVQLLHNVLLWWRFLS